jgi:DNA-binding transcriptional ArsR family regulator
MVNHSGPLDAAFSALSDGTRRAILARLALGETTVSEIARPFPVSLPAISRHLRVLEEAGLVRRRRTGREHLCALDPAGMRTAADWLETYRIFWGNSLDALAKYLSARGPEARSGDPSREPTTSRSSGRRRRRRES